MRVFVQPNGFLYRFVCPYSSFSTRHRRVAFVLHDYLLGQHRILPKRPITNQSARYEIKGNVPPLQFDGSLPVLDSDLIDALNIDTEFQEMSKVKEEINHIEQNIVGKRHAHRFHFYKR